jgi:hypothetical protein
MADEEFAESFDDFPEDDFGDLAEPAPAPAQKAPARKQQPQQQAPRGRPHPQQQQQQPQRNTVQAQAPASAPVQTPESPRYIPFILPPRNGVFDNYTGKPLMEDQDKLDLIIGMIVDLKNSVSKIEQGL